MPIVPSKTIRQLRSVVDRVKEQYGGECVLYRFTGEYESKSGLTNIEDLYDDASLTVATVSYDSPVETVVKLEWPDELSQARNGEILTPEDEPIRAKFKFSDYVTPRSYIKIPFSYVNFDKFGEDVEFDIADRDEILRLEVNSLLSSSNRDVERQQEAVMGIKRNDGDLHPNDTALSDHVPNDFFSK